MALYARGMPMVLLCAVVHNRTPPVCPPARGGTLCQAAVDCPLHPNSIPIMGPLHATVPPIVLRGLTHCFVHRLQ